MKEDTKNNKETPRKPKTYVLDTTVLIDNPNLMYRLGNSIIVIPFVVLKEIDGLKKSDDPNTAKSAREVARILDRISSYTDLAKGIKLSTGGVLAVTDKYDAFDGLASEADNKIVGTALMLKRNGQNVELLTTDANMRTAVRLKGAKGDVPLVGEIQGSISKHITTGKNSIRKSILELLSWVLLVTVILILAGLATSILTDSESIKKPLWGGILMLTILMVILVNKVCSTENYDSHEKESYLDENFLHLDKSLDEAYICNLPPFSDINKDLKM